VLPSAAHAPIAGHVTAQKLDRRLSGNLECVFGSGRDEGLAQRKPRHAGLGGCAMVSSHRFFLLTVERLVSGLGERSRACLAFFSRVVLARCYSE